MAYRRKRGASLGLSSASRRRRRTEVDDRTSLVRSTTALLVVVGVVSAGVADMYTPKVRAPIHTRTRMDWILHVEDLRARKCFKRFYRMEGESFDKLAELLRPALQRNEHYADVRTSSGVISVHVRLAVGLRILAGGSYLDAGVEFGVGLATVYKILWEVIDAINKTEEVGPFFFPQTEEECRRAADRFNAKSDKGVFDHVVAAADGLFIKGDAPTALETANVLSHFSGSKSSNGINVQATCDAAHRFSNMSIISPGSTNDWVSWNQSALATALTGLPPGYHIIGDAAYPISDQLLTPYPGRNLPPGEDSFNFHLSQLRVKIEQSFGILVSTWRILWRPLRVSLAGRPDLITAVFHLHNFLQDEKETEVAMDEEDENTGQGRPPLTKTRTLAPSWKSVARPAPSRSGETPARATLRMLLEDNKQWRPVSNTMRNS